MIHPIIRTLVVVLATAFASPAGGAGLALVGGGTYTVGQKIEITLEGTVDGGEVEFAAFAELLSSDASVVGFDDATQVALTVEGGATPWSLFPTLPCATGSCTAINQANPDLISPVAVDPFDGTISTIRLAAIAPGFSVISINEDPLSGNAADWFGASGFDTIEINVVPEPSAGAMLGLGLVWIAVGWRRSRGD